MADYFVIDKSTLRAPGEKRTATVDPAQQEQTLRAYFTQLAKNEKVEDKLTLGASAKIGTSAPMLRLTTDEETAQQLQAASKGRLTIAKVGKF